MLQDEMIFQKVINTEYVSVVFLTCSLQNSILRSTMTVYSDILLNILHSYSFVNTLSSKPMHIQELCAALQLKMFAHLWCKTSQNQSNHLRFYFLSIGLLRNPILFMYLAVCLYYH